MKNILIIAIIFGTLSLSAQQRNRHQKGKQQMHQKAMLDMTSEELATLKTKKMTLDLNLNESQQKEIYTINLSQAQDRKAKHEEREKAKENGDSKELNSKDHYTRMNAALDKKIAHKSQMQSILSDEQFKKWERQDKFNGRKKRMRKGKRKK